MYKDWIKEYCEEKNIIIDDFWKSYSKKILYYRYETFIGVTGIEGKNWKEIYYKLKTKFN